MTISLAMSECAAYQRWDASTLTVDAASDSANLMSGRETEQALNGPGFGEKNLTGWPVLFGCCCRAERLAKSVQLDHLGEDHLGTLHLLD
ncbi:hypothetical protein ACW4FQ_24725, partial [Escherichia coli]